MTNAATFIFNKEDHTWGNLLRMQLLRDNRVRYAGYIHPHPLISRVDVKVQAINGPNDTVTPSKYFSVCFFLMYIISLHSIIENIGLVIKNILCSF